MKSRRRLYGRNSLYGFIFGIVLVSLSLPSTFYGKELPVLVEISEIGEQYDGKRIAVFGWVRSAQVKTGRRGSLHLEIVVGEGEHTVYVYTVRPIVNLMNQNVIVQGIYHERGRFAGRPAEHFIVADTIVKDWLEENRRQ
ncbi:MAG: hypothetical protein ACE5GK_09325 [Nitrospiria bacterium]